MIARPPAGFLIIAVWWGVSGSPGGAAGRWGAVSGLRTVAVYQRAQTYFSTSTTGRAVAVSTVAGSLNPYPGGYVSISPEMTCFLSSWVSFQALGFHLLLYNSFTKSPAWSSGHGVLKPFLRSRLCSFSSTVHIL